MVGARVVAIFVAAGLMLGISLSTVRAQGLTCAQTVVSVRGEPASFELLARTKARANWRARVRMTPNLGDSFSTWARAMNAEERCVSGPAGTVCTFTGTPCRRP